MSDLTKLPSDLGGAALFYAQEMGWRVMPLNSMLDGKCSCGKDCETPGKHPLIKAAEASNDPDQIKKWWKKWPWANIGFWLEGSGLAALDVDVAGDKAGDKRLLEILAGDPLPSTLVAATPSGGKHIYYKEREGLPNKSNALGKGLDIWRGKHYLILPPSNHVKGGTYAWESIKDIPEWPDVLMPKANPVGRPPGGTNPNAGRIATKELLDVKDKDDVARLQHSMAFVDASDRDTWVHVGYILARAFNWSERGWEIFREWSATVDNFSEKKSHTIYFRDSHNPPDGMALTTAYIFKKATGHPNFTRWEKKDDRLKFFQSEGFEGADLYSLGDLVVKADLDFYEREGRLIEVVRISRMTEGEKKRLAALGVDRPDSYCITRELTPGQFVAKSSEKIAWWSKFHGKMRLSDYDRRVVIDFLGMGHWSSMKKFRAFTLHPTIRSLSNPTILHQTGFDEESGLYVEQPTKIAMPKAKAGLKDAQAAAKVLMSPFEHYRWLDGSLGHSSVLALVLSIGIRHCFRTQPMFLASSPVVGSGKTKLMAAAATIWYGAPPPTMVFVENEEEMEKRIGASVMAGDRVLLFDNVQAREVVNDRTLNMILTSGMAQFRILGESNQVRMSAPMTIMMTGNQMSLGPDLARRTVEIRIDPEGPSPVMRKFPFEPLEFVITHRKKLIEAALTIFHAYFTTVKNPIGATQSVPSFEDWTLIRDIIQWLGMDDVSQFSKMSMDADELYYPTVVKRLVALLMDMKPDVDMVNKKYHPSDLIPHLMARGKQWESLFHDAVEVLHYATGSREPKPDDPRSVGSIMARMVDQAVKINEEDDTALRLKSIGKRTFWIA